MAENIKTIYSVISQYIDTNGKCRILNFDDISIITSPMPLFDKPTASKNEIKYATMEAVKTFSDALNLKIISQDLYPDTKIIKGLWVESISTPKLFIDSYIPIDDEPMLDGIDIAPKYKIAPLFVEESSYLQTARDNEKIAEYLKEYTLYEWAQNPKTFGKNNFIVIENHNYSLSTAGYVFNRNRNFYQGKKLIVPDEDTMQRLIIFAEVSASNDSKLSLKYKNKKNINVYRLFLTLSDFKHENQQLIFIGKTPLETWITKHTTGNDPDKISAKLLPSNEEPYFYRNFSIKNGILSIIQNTKNKDIATAVIVSREWNNVNTNIGYNPKLELYGGVDDVSYDIYNYQGLIDQVKSSKKGKIVANIFRYADNTYAAILFL